MHQPSIYTLSDHNIDPSLIADEAKVVVRELRRAGFQAYLVGGSVRDLCLSKPPKDFDVATDAQPEQIKPLFRHCLLIGRRFRLAHVRFKRMIIEVATFRTGDTQSEDLIIHDNTWGNPEEDALRRDFTLNGLFYDIEEQTIIDYVEGFHDLKRHCLRTIGDPYLRFRQDPVRMIRLLKFQARYPELTIDSETAQAMQACLLEIVKSSPARLLEEILRMLESSYAAPFFQRLYNEGLLEVLMPHLASRLQEGTTRLLDYLEACDETHRHEAHSLSRDVLFASIVYSLIEPSIQRAVENSGHALRIHELANLAYDEMEAMTGALRHLPKRMRACICSAIGLQARLVTSGSKTDLRRRSRLLHHPDFSAALALFGLRAKIQSELQPTYETWLAWSQEYLSRDREFDEPHNYDGGQSSPNPDSKQASRQNPGQDSVTPELKQDSEQEPQPAKSSTRPRSRSSPRSRAPRRSQEANHSTDSPSPTEPGSSAEIAPSEAARPVRAPAPMKALLPPPSRLLSDTLQKAISNATPSATLDEHS